jgi:hypothetical protein
MASQVLQIEHPSARNPNLPPSSRTCRVHHRAVPVSTLPTSTSSWRTSWTFSPLFSHSILLKRHHRNLAVWSRPPLRAICRCRISLASIFLLGESSACSSISSSKPQCKWCTRTPFLLFRLAVDYGATVDFLYSGGRALSPLPF